MTNECFRVSDFRFLNSNISLSSLPNFLMCSEYWPGIVLLKSYFLKSSTMLSKYELRCSLYLRKISDIIIRNWFNLRDSLTFGRSLNSRVEESAPRHNRAKSWSPYWIVMSQNWCIATRLKRLSCAFQHSKSRVQKLAWFARRHPHQASYDCAARRSDNSPISLPAQHCSAASSQRFSWPQQWLHLTRSLDCLPTLQMGRLHRLVCFGPTIECRLWHRKRLVGLSRRFLSALACTLRFGWCLGRHFQSI